MNTITLSRQPTCQSNRGHANTADRDHSQVFIVLLHKHKHMHKNSPKHVSYLAPSLSVYFTRVSERRVTYSYQRCVCVCVSV